jgi:CHAT domain/NB-ARC domain
VVEMRLEVRDFENPSRWRWVLSDSGGAFLADHEVRLDTACWQFEAFTDLLGYLFWHAAPDRLAVDEARIVGDLGEWIGSEVLGPIAAIMVQIRPATVRVVIPSEARALSFRPLELAHAGGQAIAVQNVTLVIQPGPDDSDSTASTGARAGSAGERLRMLGLFSLPEGGQPLNLRRERYSLVRLIHRIAAAGNAAEVRVLQYGVTRGRLRQVLEEAEGWDVIHISGHGAPGELLLETEAGRPDRVTAEELADMLDLARERVSLVTVSACWSAGLTTAEQRHLLGLPVPDRRADAARGGRFAPDALATELAARLGCAVLAMRYPVDDEFAIALTGKLYDLLAAKGQALPQAVAIALKELLTGSSGRGFPALSVATPTLFGGRAVGLRLAAPARVQPEDYSTTPLKLAGFPSQPDRFVGRTAVMARASAALAAGSGIPGVLLHGMPGGGKTACALELVYTQEHAFDRLVWCKAPDEGMDTRGSLTDFALTLERDLPGFQMIGVLADKVKLTAFLPRLTELVKQRRVLIVIDNAESLLTDAGQWRDEQWGQVIAALSAHGGEGRLVLTSRRIPVADVTGLRVTAVDALSADEALLLARELPHLRDLICGELPGVDRDTARRLALGVLNIAQGHPKLLELADGQAAQPERLAELVAAGESAWRDQGGLPDGFFTTAEATSSAADYLHVLAAWTQVVTSTLEPGERTLFWFLCCLEEPDRERAVLERNWADLWVRLGQDGELPVLDQAITAIIAKGLVAVRVGTNSGGASYPMHPGVSAAARVQAGNPFQDAVDANAAGYWDAVFRHASGEAGDAALDTGLLVRAGLAAVPYLMRLGQWTTAGAMLERAFIRDPSRPSAATVLPAIQEITARDARQAGVLARVLAVLDPAAAKSQMRAYLDAAVARGDYRAAWVTAGPLVELCLDSGRLAEALTLADLRADYSRQGGLGPWTQLLDEVYRLQVLTEMGQAARVLADVQALRDRMQALPAVSGRDEAVPPWEVREVLFGTGRYAAGQLGRWEDALDLSAEQITSRRDRSAPATEIARSRFNDYGPLLGLGRTDEALALLLECRQVFQEARDTGTLGKTFSALADTEDHRGHGDAAIGLERDALRYTYLAGDVTGIMISYHNLGNYLRRHASQPAAALSCHLAAALIGAITGGADTDHSVRAAAGDLRALDTGHSEGPAHTAAYNSDEAATPSLSAIPDTDPLTAADVRTPADVPDLCRQLTDIPGTDLPRLLAGLVPDPATADQALRDLITQAKNAAADQNLPIPQD